MAHIPHTTFHSITIHTAKCDLCDLRNKDILKRCKDCGWSICTPCWIRRGDNGAHVINVGDGSWNTNRDDNAAGRENVGATVRQDFGTIVPRDRTEIRSEGGAEGREEGEIWEGEGDEQSHTVAGDTGKGKEKATETGEATENIDVEMGGSYDIEDADFEKARQESLLTSSHTLGRSHGEGSSSRRKDRYNHDNLFESSGLTSNSNPSESSVSRDRSKHRKINKKGDQSSSNTGEAEKGVKQRRRSSQGTQFAVRKPRSSSTATNTSRKTGNLTARNPPKAAAEAASPPLPKPKIQIRVPRTRNRAPNTHTSHPSSTQTSSTLALSTQAQAQDTCTLNQAQHSTSSSTSHAAFDTTNPSIDLLLHAASVLETQPNTQSQAHPHCAQPVPSLLPPESFHSDSQQSQQPTSHDYSASNTSSLPELIEMKFYTRDSSVQLPSSHQPAQHQNVNAENTSSREEGANDDDGETGIGGMSSEPGGTSAVNVDGNGVAPRLRNLYWQAAIVRDKNGRRV